MWTGKFSRYLLVLLCAFGSNAVRAQKTVNVYFNERQANGVPTISFGSSAPAGVTVEQSGLTWALNYKESIISYPNCTDRVIVKDSGSTPSTASISFTGFKYEVKQVKWNVMCDAFSLLFDKPMVETAINSEKGQKITGTFESKNTSFNVVDFPNTTKKNGELGFEGLKSIVIKDYLISEYCRVFLKAGTRNQEATKSTSTKHFYAFSISYYEPSVSFKRTMPSQIKLGQTADVSNDYEINHKGAFNFTTTYKSSNENIFTVDKNGVITPKNLGKANITVTITDGKVSTSESKEIEVINPQLASNQYNVVLMYNDETTDCETVIATLKKEMPTVTPPTRTGYIFRGYFDSKDYEQNVDQGSKYYKADGTSKNNWDKNNNSTLYGHWTAKTYTINFDACGGKLSDKVGIRTEGQDRYIETSNDQSFVGFDVQCGSKIADRFWCSDKITIKPGYKFLGWFTEKTGGTKVYSVDDDECSFNAIKGDYWTGNSTEGNWKYDAASGTLNLYAQYECKFEIVDNGERINFKKGYDITSYDILAAIEEDLETYKVSPMIVDVTKYQNYIMAGKGLGGFLGGKGYSIDENSNLEAFNTVIEEARLDNKLASNALVYLSGSSSMYTDATNVVMTNEQQCKNLVVTDRAPIKIPYAFKADKALYERNKNYSDKDAAKAQAANSKWGTLCLPYPIKNNTNNVKFYKLAGLKNNYMHFTPMDETVIPANTPVLYKRLEGVGSEVKIKEADVDIPVNTSYSTNSGESYDSWQFVGTLTTKMFCGKDYKNVPEGAEKLDGSKEYYYFKQDKFTHLSKTGSLIILPYRAYFTTTPANAKFTTFSIIAMDEEGATDITNLIDNDAEGDGKIYDLNGRRVMQPVSGRLYIVNGQKKVY